MAAVIAMPARRRGLVTAWISSIAGVLVASSLVLAAPSAASRIAAHGPSGPSTSAAGGNKSGSALNMEVVGQSDLGGRGFNGDVWYHAGYAYIGHWGFIDWATGNDRFCPQPPNSGVAVVDVRDPANPTMVGRLENPVGTSAEDVVAFTARFGPLAGRDVAAVGIQVCGADPEDASVRRGLQLFDVTDPSAPVEIGFWSSECCARGVHEFEVQHRADLGRTFAYLTVPDSRKADPDPPS